MTLPTSKPYEARPYKGGRVKGLFIGINYEGTDAALSGCINDVSTMLALLEHMHFPLQEAVILVDDVRFPGVSGLPTHDNIMMGLQWLSAGAKAGDIMFLHYSGHGTQITSEMRNPDEADGMDEALVPVDYETEGCILDDVIFQYVARPLPEGCRLTALLDCCHSGTLMDLPFVYTAEPGAPASYSPSGNNQCLGDVVMISGCQDSQTSADAVGANFKTPAAHPGQAGGACTNALQDTILNNKDGKLTYAQILDRMRGALTNRNFSQIPQLSCSKPIDVDKIFDFRNLIHAKPIAEIENIVVQVEQGETSGKVGTTISVSSQAPTITTVHEQQLGSDDDVSDADNIELMLDEESGVTILETVVNTVVDSCAQGIAQVLALVPPPPPPMEAPILEFEFEPAQIEEQLVGLKPSDWRTNEDAQNKHGFGLGHFRKNHGHKRGKCGHGYGAGRRWFEFIGTGNWGVNRRGEERRRGRQGKNRRKGWRREKIQRQGRGRGRKQGRGRGQGRGHGGGRGRGRGGADDGVVAIHNGPGRFGRKGNMFQRLGSFVVPTDQDSLKELFSTFDTDQSGTIDRDEFVKAMVELEAEMGLHLDPKQLKKQFQRFDANRDGRLSFDEFAIYMLGRAKE